MRNEEEEMPHVSVKAEEKLRKLRESENIEEAERKWKYLAEKAWNEEEMKRRRRRKPDEEANDCRRKYRRNEEKAEETVRKLTSLSQ